MQISTIIPVYNAEKYLKRCIESVLAQKGIQNEIICVDDGSTDHSLAILREYERKYDNIHVLTQKNMYAGTARNYGLSIAYGEYIHFLDADDYVLDGAYLKIYKMAKEKKADYIKARNKAFDMQSGARIDNDYYDMNSFSNKVYGEFFSFTECYEVLRDTTSAPWAGFVKKDFIVDKQIIFNHIGFNSPLLAA